MSLFVMSVPSTEGRFGRGVVRGGAGRGTCVRSSQLRTRAAAGQPRRGTTGPAPVRPPYNAKAERCRGGAPRGAGARVMSARARRSGLARTRIGPPWSNPGHAPLRRAIPLIRGTEREGKYGRTPAPGKATGAGIALPSHLRTNRKMRAPSHALVPAECQRVGPNGAARGLHDASRRAGAPRLNGDPCSGAGRGGSLV